MSYELPSIREKKSETFHPCYPHSLPNYHTSHDNEFKNIL